MKRVHWITMAAAAMVAACAETRSSEKPGEAAGREQELDVRDLGQEQRVALADAISNALAGAPGEVVEAGLEGEVEAGRRDVFIEVMVFNANGDVIEVKLDPATGRVISSETEEDAKESAEIAATARSLPPHHLALADLARRGAAGAHGKVVSAEFGVRGVGHVVGVVEILDGKDLREVTLDSVSGAVLGRREVPKEDEDEDEEDEDDAR